ncbi:hypothetical protein MJO28_009328 [Puccinia striiformis f. sp. tritici]|uniref:Uncharacterized protein n=1 Tax=Puccinia striiformis f. sp. tritici TaxID=168172 RepID=A0ACC0E8X2_9BASI|nr:hypothetical protein MJO28_009328 [Puccinia striiformis f. sp. tritici]
MSQEIPNPTQPSPPAPNLTISPDVLMQIAQLLAAQKIPIPPVPSPVPSGSIKPSASSIDPLAASKSSPELLEGIFDDNNNNNNNEDGMSYKSLDNLVHHKTTEGDLLANLVPTKAAKGDVPLPPKQTTGPGEGDLVTDIKNYDYEIGEPMDPPPPMRFLSMEDLFQFVKTWAKHHGYGVSKGNSHTGKNIYIRCDRGGTYSGKLENLVKRDSSTRKCECPFQVKGLTRKCECPFQVKGSTSQAKGPTDKSWHLAAMHGEHNHPASHCPSAHPSHQQLNPEEMEEVERLSKSNVKTTQILLQLRQADPNTLAVNKTINNALHKIREKELDGKTSIEALLSLLQATNWMWDVLTNSDGVIQNLFFAHPGSVHLAHINHHVALLDATYKTNRYNLPLLHVIGQTATNRSFSIAFCFMMYENDAGYLWAVENLRKHIWKPERTPPVFITDRETALRNVLTSVFPDSQAHLCAWHLNKNIVLNCRKHFPAGEKKSNSRGQPKKKSKSRGQPKLGESKSKEKSEKTDPWDIFWEFWTQTSLSETVDIYEANLAALKQNLSKRPAVLEYLQSSILPTFVTTLSGDLLSVGKALAHAVDHQISHVHEAIGRDTIKTLTNIPRSFLALPKKVSQHAILEANRQFKRLDDLDPTDPCSKTFSTGLGIPCCHMIADILENRGALEPDDFHPQWRLDYNPEGASEEEPEFDLQDKISRLHLLLSHEPIGQLPRIFEQFHQILSTTHVAAKVQDPSVKTETKGRPSHQKGASNSTKQDPSAHEHVEKQVEKERKKRPIEAQVNSRKKVKQSVDDEEVEEKDVRKTEEVKKTTIKFRLPKKTNTHKQETDKINAEEQTISKEHNLIQSPYHLEVPEIFKKYVREIFNPKGDGNCGYRCLAKALGYADHGWFQVRQEITKEAESNRSAYLRLLGGENAMNTIVAGLLVVKIDEPIPPEKWLNKMDHGQMIANAYSRLVVFLSIESCATFLPTRLGPKDSTLVSEPVYLLHVSGNHWVLADVQELDGLKPLPPVVGSSRVASQSTKEWKLQLKRHLTLYNQEVQRVKA